MTHREITSSPAGTATIYVVIDTNIVLDRDDLKSIESLITWFPLPGAFFERVVVVVPWVVLQVMMKLIHRLYCIEFC